MERLDNLDLGKVGKEYIGPTLYRQSGKASGLGGHEWASRLKGISYLVCGESCGYGPGQECGETRQDRQEPEKLSQTLPWFLYL